MRREVSEKRSALRSAPTCSPCATERETELRVSQGVCVRLCVCERICVCGSSCWKTRTGRDQSNQCTRAWSDLLTLFPGFVFNPFVVFNLYYFLYLANRMAETIFIHHHFIWFRCALGIYNNWSIMCMINNWAADADIRWFKKSH